MSTRARAASTRRTARGLVAFGATIVLALTGCGTGDLSAADLEDKVAAKLERHDDREGPVEVRCEGGLDAKVDATQDCRATSRDEHADLHVKATGVDPLKLTVVSFLTREELAEQISEILVEEGHEVEEASCVEPLMGRPGASTHCQVSMDGGGRIVEATVTAVEGLRINFTFQEA